MSKVIVFFENLLSFSPLSLHRLIAKKILLKDTVCDVGCGDGKFYQDILRVKKLKNNWFGVDIHLPSLISAKGRGIYKGLINSDIRCLSVKPKQASVVIAIHSIEHVEKNGVLEKLEMLSQRLLIIVTPNGYVPFSHEEKAPHHYQTHKCGYTAEDFKKRGFSVRGIGCRFICGRLYKEGKLPVWIRRCFSAVSLLSTCFTYFFPKIADHLYCFKRFDE